MIFKNVEKEFQKFMEVHRIPQIQLDRDASNPSERIDCCVKHLLAIGAIMNPQSAIISALLTGFYFRDWLEAEKKKEAQDQKECDILDVLWNRS